MGCRVSHHVLSTVLVFAVCFFLFWNKLLHMGLCLLFSTMRWNLSISSALNRKFLVMIGTWSAHNRWLNQVCEIFSSWQCWLVKSPTWNLSSLLSRQHLRIFISSMRIMPFPSFCHPLAAWRRLYRQRALPKQLISQSQSQSTGSSLTLMFFGTCVDLLSEFQTCCTSCSLF